MYIGAIRKKPSVVEGASSFRVSHFFCFFYTNWRLDYILTKSNEERVESHFYKSGLSPSYKPLYLYEMSLNINKGGMLGI